MRCPPSDIKEAPLRYSHASVLFYFRTLINYAIIHEKVAAKFATKY